MSHGIVCSGYLFSAPKCFACRVKSYILVSSEPSTFIYMFAVRSVHSFLQTANLLWISFNNGFLWSSPNTRSVKSITNSCPGNRFSYLHFRSLQVLQAYCEPLGCFSVGELPCPGRFGV
ncbi:hypothetical protein ILYODFUR_012697, partial [Ilyodon furcidens]